MSSNEPRIGLTHTCPDWCTQHQTLDIIDRDGTPLERHTQWLFTRYAPARPDVPSLALSLGAVESSRSPWGVSLGVQMFDDIAQELEPAEARRLAAALIRGAEVVEAARTASCPECERKVAASELEYADEDTGVVAGVCLRCLSARRVAEMNARRSVLQVVR